VKADQLEAPGNMPESSRTVRGGCARFSCGGKSIDSRKQRTVWKCAKCLKNTNPGLKLNRIPVGSGNSYRDRYLEPVYWPSLPMHLDERKETILETVTITWPSCKSTF
jgi:hypothetical protein